tara:strand:- start:19322 stop:20500 length:1179 start_codon:yes stop_codon:yes gene_type:complete
MVLKTSEIDDTIKEGYKVEAKFFQEYDIPPQHESQPIATKEKNLDPFKKVNWKNIFDENYKENYRFKKIDGELVWAFFIKESKSNRGIKDIADDVVGRIQPGDLQITRFAYKKTWLPDMIDAIQREREETNDFFTTLRDIWFTDINQELEEDKLVMEKLGAKWLSSKITAVGSEVRGLYYCGEKEQPGVSKYEDITIKKIDIDSPVTTEECSELVEEIKNYQDALNPWSYDGINGNYGGPEKTWYTIEIVPIKPNSPIDYKILDTLPKLKKIVETITTVEQCTWLVITRVEPKTGLIQRHTDIGYDSWDYKTKNGPKVGNSLRVHFPIQVDDDCVFTQVGLDGKEVDHRLKVGEYYYMDKRKPHWVENKSENYRFHVIMDIECEQKHLDALL